ncbi:MAG: glycoside hydrolase family 43 protein [Candidatus Pseudobacter hemicellulosilyticus]|uniref:Glycoside hydrolase family 43 protein n=1 Tax=Candidatus Pseudobacter hemicellulosilyticus TaxID=3121375 RepID=A0AAJ5WUY5_9BACT|nr:MAG: glycoside hydrolase family 43 protein [Pseudobacter sp.]
MMRARAYLLLTIGLLAGSGSMIFCGKAGGGDTDTPPPPAVQTFVNPLLNGADPWVIKKNDTYYYTHTLGNRIGLWKTKAMSKLAAATPVEVYRPPAGQPNSENVWAPELHYLDNKWYLYYTAGSGPLSTQLCWVLENAGPDPTQGTWTSKGRIYATDTDFWAIDGTILETGGNRYFLWSGQPEPGKQNQNIYIAKMTNPWTLQTPTVMLTKPELGWETVGGPVNEGPQILQNKEGHVFLVYSASGCWTDDYALGMLSLKPGADPLQLDSWIKKQQPVFSKNADHKAYGPGHNSFFMSPDGKENWILYHANSNSGDGCTDKRNVRMQPFSWNSDGSPKFGEPVKAGTAINVPSGE